MLACHAAYRFAASMQLEAPFLSINAAIRAVQRATWRALWQMYVSLLKQLAIMCASPVKASSAMDKCASICIVSARVVMQQAAVPLQRAVNARLQRSCTIFKGHSTGRRLQWGT
jgi:hypothetical protein